MCCSFFFLHSYDYYYYYCLALSLSFHSRIHACRLFAKLRPLIHPSRRKETPPLLTEQVRKPYTRRLASVICSSCSKYIIKMIRYDFESLPHQSVQQMIPGMEDECCSNHQSHFFSGMRHSNSDHYGLLGADFNNLHPTFNNNTNTSTMVPHKPRVSISDEEMYQALNISPIVTSSFQPTADFLPTMSPLQLQNTMHPNTSEYCYPSTSTMEQSMTPFDTQMYLPPDVISMGPSPTRELASPTFSIHSFAPTTSTAYAEEDLEVELINNSNQNDHDDLADDIDIFLHSGTSDEFRSSKDTTFSESSSNNPTPSSRPAYAKKLSASSALQNNTLKPAPTSPLFLQTSLDPTGFTPLLTPKSDALLQRKLSEATHHHQPIHTTAISRRDSYPISNLPPFASPSTSAFKRPLISSKKEFSSSTDDSVFASTAAFEKFKPLFNSDYELNSSLHSTPEKQSTSRDRSFSRDITKVEEEVSDILSDIDIDDKSEELALNVVEKLFIGPGVFSNEEPPAISVDEPFRSASQQSTHPPSAKKIKYPRCSLEGKMEQLKEKAVVENDVLDDWETANDDDITGRMEKLLKDAEKTNKKKDRVTAKMNEMPSTSDWDPNCLPHVLEIYGIPDYKMQDDVVKGLEYIGYGDSNVKWIERKIVLVAFENAARAKSLLTLPKHDWLRFRTLANSPKIVQDAAKENASRLTIARKKQTNASVARRMVENVLGQKSSVSAEQRQNERKQIADARAAKKNSVKWDS